VCTLCRCKFRENARKPKNVVELAKEEHDAGETVWIVGTGGSGTRSAGHGKIVYAMRVDEALTREEYYADRRFKKREDNLIPKDDFEKRYQFALISRHFYYFGANAVRIPVRFSWLEKKGPGFRRKFDPKKVGAFVRWLEKNHELGEQGQPCASSPEQSKKCKSSC
jgi:Nucleotide modification associated domain 2